MNRKEIYWLILAISVLASSPAYGSPSIAGHPAHEIMMFYERDLEDRGLVDPYLVSILALNETAHGRHLPEVERFILWYFSKLNYPDKHGLTGTIYNYVIENGFERATDEYDSVDGYAGIFLHLVHEYTLKSGNRDLPRRHWNHIENIAYLIAHLQDKDGLTVALSDSRVKYLMDNCEAFGGISAYLALKKLLGKPEDGYYRNVRDAIRKGILDHLAQTASLFAWAAENGEKSKSTWQRFYPDAYAQLFPIYYDLLADMPKRKKDLWRAFVARHAGKAGKFPIEQRIMFELTKKKMEGR